MIRPSGVGCQGPDRSARPNGTWHNPLANQGPPAQKYHFLLMCLELSCEGPRLHRSQARQTQKNREITMQIKVITAVAIVALAFASSIAAAPAKKDIVDTAVDSKQFPTLVSLVKKAGLVDTLKGDGPFTVFAPTEEAFKKLDKKTLDAVLNDAELLKKVLLYHVVPGNVMAADVVKLNGKAAKTALKGADVHIRVKNGKVIIDKSNVVTTDIKATNGVIHVIDTVLVPSASELAAK